MDWEVEVIPLPVADVDRAKTFYTEHRGITDATPGTVRGVHLVVTDIDAARVELVARGVEVGAVRHMTPNGFVDGVDPAHADYKSFAEFADPDGNTFVRQERGHAGAQ
jgi:catechol 2,3-dioxygenase-like lactoylglutathione lyase family enzyme